VNGVEEYNRLVERVSKDVAAFSQGEMMRESGTLEDEQIDPYIDAALRKADKLIIKGSTGDVVAIRREDIAAAMDEVAGWKVSAAKRFGVGLNKAMKARGGGDKTFLSIKVDGKKTTTPGYKFPACPTAEAFYEALDSRLGVAGDDAYCVAEKAKAF
jgi:hypothetical protein